MRRRALTVRSILESEPPPPPPPTAPRYLLAASACAALVIGYAGLGTFLRSKFGGSVPMILLWLSVAATWRAITKQSRRDR